ncbi:hypothetical protein [Actinomadura macrotermitis]|uniref:Uncharacterized protein n=1 Tax=Actinomadura macrotermitis TaxID=2585200 RepID=A0A7K0C758_9ACTN|nr:hypothetical protein [Actinomadura macrotermitis]MQY09290.1 hypothetical protein [Actinomadura macrotermitis]
MHDDYRRSQQRRDDYYNWQRATSSRWDSEKRRKEWSDDRRRGWEENGYPGFWEIVAGLIIFFVAIAMMSGH